MDYKLILSVAFLLNYVIATESKVVNFTETEGFKPGLLNLQNGWTSDKHTVNPKGVGYIELVNEPWRTGYFTETIPAQSTTSYTISTIFSFSETAEAGNNDILSLLFNHKTSSKGTARCFISRSSKGGYKIGYKGTNKALYEGKVFSKERLGLSESNLNSAPLKCTFSLTKGTTSKDWNVALQLENLTSGKIVSSYIKSGVETTQELFDAAAIFGGFSSSRPEDVTHTTNRRIHSIEIHDIPTDETLSLLIH